MDFLEDWEITRSSYSLICLLAWNLSQLKLPVNLNWALEKKSQTEVIKDEPYSAPSLPADFNLTKYTPSSEDMHSDGNKICKIYWIQRCFITLKRRDYGKITGFFWIINDKQQQSKPLYYNDIDTVQLRSLKPKKSIL